MRIFVQTYGCQMNKLDSVLVAGAARETGFELIDDIKEADAVLINTCSVRQHAEQRVMSNLGYLQHLKKTKPELIVAVFGCMAQRLGNDLLKHPAVDIVCGPAQIPQLISFLQQALLDKRKSLAVTENILQHHLENCLLENFESHYDTDEQTIPGQAYISIMRGCSKFCSYCIVPYVRGLEISRPPAVIFEQIKRLADRGIRQVTLLGQAVNSYEYKSGDKIYCLADIFELASRVDGIEWIKFITSYPTEKYFEKICFAMRDLPKVCRYLHIPAQSGSDKILKAMNRKYNSRQYLRLLEKAKEIVPNLSVAGDFIVGFPGETDYDFQQTINLVQKADYKNCFVFKYSPRPGTIGDEKLEDDVPPDVKQKRNIELLAVQEKISDRLSKEFLNKEVRVLVEGPSKKAHPSGGNDIQLVARTSTDWIVVFDGPANLAGRFAKVKIVRSTPLTLFGLSSA